MNANNDYVDTRLRVLIAAASDRHRQRLRDVLVEDGRFEVATGVELPSELPSATSAHTPNVLLVVLGDGDGGRHVLSALGALRAATEQEPSMAAVVLAEANTPADLISAIRAGVRGVLRRDVDAVSLRTALMQVGAGLAVVGPVLTANLFDYVATNRSEAGVAQARTNLDPAVQRALSPREREVLRLLAQGNRNNEIAARLGVSVGTVKTHLRHIYRKLEVDDRVSAVLTAFQLRLPDAA